MTHCKRFYNEIPQGQTPLSVQLIDSLVRRACLVFHATCPVSYTQEYQIVSTVVAVPQYDHYAHD